MSQTVNLGADTSSSGDVVDLILADHRAFETLFRALRNREEDRASRLRELADLLVAHALAEELEVYPHLKAKAPSERDDIEHSVAEHAEGHEALARLQAIADVDSDEFEEALEELVEVVNHHVDEEERDVLNAAREEVAPRTRLRLGEAFMRARLGWLRNGAGDPAHVRTLLVDQEEQGAP